MPEIKLHKRLPNLSPEEEQIFTEAINEAYLRGKADGKPKWIPVTERLPEKHGKYLAVVPSKLAGCEHSIWLIWYDPKGGFHDSDPEWGDIPMDDVTHWMPLPMPPKGE